MSEEHHGLLAEELGNIEQLEALFRDYRGESTLLRELAQNADDATGCRHLWITLLPADEARGRAHPLLSEPALLVANDGAFDPELDAEGLRKLRSSGKARTHGRTGRFGLGLKSIFQFGEAFFYAVRSPAHDGFVSPWSAVGVRQAWDAQWSHARAAIGRTLFEAAPDANFFLWLPLRRRDSPVYAVPELPRPPFLAQQDIDLEKMAKNLRGSIPAVARFAPGLRRLEKILLRGPHGGDECRLESTGRLESASAEGASRGTVEVNSEKRVEFALRQRASAALDDLKERRIGERRWPMVRFTDGKKLKIEPQPRQPHGGAWIALLDDGKPPHLWLRHAVYLPLETPIAKVELPWGRRESVEVVLHGDLFVDPGRRGLARNAGEVVEEWNRAVLMQLALPMLPAVLSDVAGSLDANDELALARALVRALSKLDGHEQSAVTGRHVWLRAWSEGRIERGRTQDLKASEWLHVREPPAEPLRAAFDMLAAEGRWALAVGPALLPPRKGAGWPIEAVRVLLSVPADPALLREAEALAQLARLLPPGATGELADDLVTWLAPLAALDAGPTAVAPLVDRLPDERVVTCPTDALCLRRAAARLRLPALLLPERNGRGARRIDRNEALALAQELHRGLDAASQRWLLSELHRLRDGVPADAAVFPVRAFQPDGTRSWQWRMKSEMPDARADGSGLWLRGTGGDAETWAQLLAEAFEEPVVLLPTVEGMSNTLPTADVAGVAGVVRRCPPRPGSEACDRLVERFGQAWATATANQKPRLLATLRALLAGSAEAADDELPLRTAEGDWTAALRDLGLAWCVPPRLVTALGRHAATLGIAEADPVDCLRQMKARSRIDDPAVALRAIRAARELDPELRDWLRHQAWLPTQTGRVAPADLVTAEDAARVAALCQRFDIATPHLLDPSAVSVSDDGALQRLVNASTSAARVTRWAADEPRLGLGPLVAGGRQWRRDLAAALAGARVPAVELVSSLAESERDRVAAALVRAPERAELRTLLEHLAAGRHEALVLCLLPLVRGPEMRASVLESVWLPTARRNADGRPEWRPAKDLAVTDAPIPAESRPSDEARDALDDGTLGGPAGPATDGEASLDDFVATFRQDVPSVRMRFGILMRVLGKVDRARDLFTGLEPPILEDALDDALGWMQDHPEVASIRHRVGETKLVDVLEAVGFTEWSFHRYLETNPLPGGSTPSYGWIRYRSHTRVADLPDDPQNTRRELKHRLEQILDKRISEARRRAWPPVSCHVLAAGQLHLVTTLTGRQRSIPVLDSEQAPPTGPQAPRTVWLRLPAPDASIQDQREALERAVHRVIEAQGRTPHLKPFWDRFGDPARSGVEAARSLVIEGLEIYLPQLAPHPPRALRECVKRLAALRLAAKQRDVEHEQRKAWRDAEKALVENAAPLRAALCHRLEKHWNYGISRVLFELVQNADDAQLGNADGFVRIVARDGRLTLTYPGKRLTLRDVECMLVVGASGKEETQASDEPQKAGGAAYTGRLGLGFKTVHLLSDEPLVISGEYRFAIEACVLPRALDEDAVSRILGRVPSDDETIIHLPLRPGITLDDVLADFRRLAPVMVRLCRAVRRIELDDPKGSDPGEAPQEGQTQVTLRLGHPGARDQHAQCMLVWLGADGGLSEPPRAFGRLPTFWMTAPTVAPCDAGFVLQADFQPESGRRQVAENPENKQRLAELSVVVARSLRGPHANKPAFWRTLWSRVNPASHTPPVAAFAKAFWTKLLEDGGLEVVPSGPDGQHLTCVGAITTCFDETVAEKPVVEALRAWPSFGQAFPDTAVVPQAVYVRLCTVLGFEKRPPKKLDDVLKELARLDSGEENGLGPALARALAPLANASLTPETRERLRAFLAASKLKDADGNWQAATAFIASGRNLHHDYKPAGEYLLGKFGSVPLGSVTVASFAWPDVPRSSHTPTGDKAVDFAARLLELLGDDALPPQFRGLFANDLAGVTRFVRASDVDVVPLVLGALVGRYAPWLAGQSLTSQERDGLLRRLGLSPPPGGEGEVARRPTFGVLLPPEPLDELQNGAAAALARNLAADGRATLSFPTGVGKTRTAWAVVLERLRRSGAPQRVLWTAPGNVLLHQAARALHGAWTASAADLSLAWSLGNSAPPPGGGKRHEVRFETIQTAAGGALGPKPTLIVVDEAHWGGRQTEKLCAQYADVPRLCLTATPVRPGKALPTSLLGKITWGPGRDELESRSVLRRIDKGGVRSLDLLSADELDDESALDDEMALDDEGERAPTERARRVYLDPRNLTRVAETLRHEVPASERALVFARFTEQARSIAALLNDGALPRLAECVTGETPQVPLQEVLQRFEDGRLRFLVSVDMLTRGYDVKGVRYVVIVRNTVSPVLYVQMLGRVLRVPPDERGRDPQQILPAVVFHVDARRAEGLRALMDAARGVTAS